MENTFGRSVLVDDLVHDGLHIHVDERLVGGNELRKLSFDILKRLVMQGFCKHIRVPDHFSVSFQSYEFGKIEYMQLEKKNSPGKRFLRLFP
jgi:hypothetical protein